MNPLSAEKFHLHIGQVRGMKFSAPSVDRNHVSARKLTCAVWFVLILSPAAWLAWTWRQMPQLGFYHDDALYWVSAQSLATGHGYRILSLPTQPFQTKYPPLLPALLALVWKASPEFPANLPWATLAVWVLFPAYIGLSWLFFRRMGFSTKQQVLLTTAAAINPVAVLFSFTLMPELLFTCLLLAAILACERSTIFAGILGGLAYAAKTAALPLLAAVPLAYALRRSYRSALLFGAAMLPFVVSWQVWVSQHLSSAQDPVTLYYTNYFGYRKISILSQDLPLVIWYNLDGLLMGIGKLLTFDLTLFESKHLERVVAIAAIAGVIRLARRTGRLQYPLSALGISAMLLVWHYQPDQRFVFPLYPLLAAGLWTELANVVKTLRLAWEKAEPGGRVVAVGVAGVLATFALFVAGANLIGVFRFVPNLMTAYSEDFAARRPAYAWLAHSAPETARIFAYDDPVVYLYTGRTSCGIPVPTRFLYRDDSESIDRLVDSIPAFAREHRLTYLLLTPGDFYRDLHEQRAARLRQDAGSDPGLRQAFQAHDVSVYAVDW